MSAANGIKPESSGAATLRRCATNLMAAFATLLRPVRRHSPPAPLLMRQQIFIVAGAFGAVILIGMIFFDASAANAARQLPRWVVSAFNWFTDFGKSGWFLWPLAILLVLLAARPPSLAGMSQRVLAAAMGRVGFLFVAIGAPSLFVTIIKRLIGRARPFVTGVADPYVFDPTKWSAAYAGMPAGHATTAFAVLVAFGTLWPRARTMLLIYALLIAASRVIVTAHYVTDVLAGALVGLIGALLVRHYFAARRIGFGVTSSGAVTNFPGPSWRRLKALGRALLSD